jgi:hypothetical protein
MKSEKTLLQLGFWIPVINIILDIAMGLLTNLKTPIALFRVVFMVAAITFFIAKFKWVKSKLNFVILLYLFFLFIVCLFSTDLQESFLDGFLKMSVTMLMLPLGIKLGQLKQNTLAKSMFWVMVLLLVNYAFSQVFKIGVSVYDEDSFYKGGATASAPIIIVLGLLVMFNAMNLRQLPYNKWIILAVSVASLMVIIISVKRGAILALGLSFLVYLIWSPNKIRSFQISLLTGLAFTFIAMQYSELIMTRIEARTSDRNEIENENRFKESVYLLNEFENASVGTLLFGDEAFHSQVVFKKYFGRERQLHVDYNILLHGTGLFGFVLYMSIFYLIYSLGKFIKKLTRFYFHKNALQKIKEDYTLLISVIVMSLIMSISGGIQFVSYRAMLFLVLGVCIGQMMGTVKTQQQIKENLQPSI